MLAKGRTEFRDVDPSCVFLPNTSRIGNINRHDIPVNVANAPLENVASRIEDKNFKSPKASLISTFDTGFQNTNE